MNLTEVKKSLDKMFAREFRQGSIRNVVFWYDEDGAFCDDIDSLLLENAKIIKLYDNNMFATKLYIEETDTTSNLLVYSPMLRPHNKENWLTDTIKYSQTFSTDETSLNLLNFKIDSSLRATMEKYKLFFRNNDRCKRFESYNLSPYSETKIDVGVLSALCKLPAPNFDNVIKTLLAKMADNDTTIIESISKFADVDTLWKLIQKSYAYKKQDDKGLFQYYPKTVFDEQNLGKLAIMLLITHLSSSTDAKLPNEWEEYVSTNTNCFVFVDNFMKNAPVWNEYNALAELVADKLNLEKQLSKWSIDEIIDCDTFEQFDRYIILRICENIYLNVGEYEKYRKIINNRRNRRYFEQFENEYDVLLNACKFLELCDIHKDLQGNSAVQLYMNYTKDYYKFDYYYRNFIKSFDRLDNSDIFKELFDKIENTYTNWYLNELSVKWCDSIGDEQSWSIAGVLGQQNFYDNYIRRFIADNERVVVIISDGLRYESATELLKILNAQQKGSSEINSMLGVLPSYTKLGMAALLPHKKIEITENADILIDGVSTQGTENREKILKTVKDEAVAITYDKLMDLSPQQISEKFKGIKLIYIYHNAIDARGDNASTEREVFDATDKAFKELSGLITKLKSNISAINIMITSDHGYIYRRTPLAESDKTPKELANSIEAKRRFILTKENAQIPTTQEFSMSYLENRLGDTKAIIPRATNCYKVQGAGTNYVHGGTSLQEVAIPVIRFKSDKNSSVSMGAKKVSISLTNISRKITSVITYLSFFQNEKVEEKVLPLRVKAFFVDDKDNRISNENIIIAESISINPDERTYKEKFTLKDLAYDKTKEYYLIIKDEDELVNKELDRIPFTIDLVFGGSIKI